MQLQGILAGKLFKAPEMYFSEKGTAYAKMSLPSDVYDSRIKKSRTTWVNITTFGANAEFCEKNLEKGSVILVTGTLDIQLKTKKNGEPYMAVDMIAFKVEASANYGEKYVYEQKQPIDDFSPVDLSRSVGELEEDPF